jgi:hypothetical protein
MVFERARIVREHATGCGLERDVLDACGFDCSPRKERRNRIVRRMEPLRDEAAMPGGAVVTRW